MSVGAYILVGGAAFIGCLIVTGNWRRVFLAFRLNPKRMTVDHLGLHFTTPADIDRVNGVFASFLGAFNAMISSPSGQAWRRFTDTQPSLYQPFAHEGAAMGYSLRRLGWCNAEAFERDLVHAAPGYRYLHYVGLGFWAGMRRHAPSRLQRIVSKLDPLHGYLCFDGYGFKHAFFDLPTDSTALRQLDRFTGYARNAAYHGVGRALWFRTMPRVDLLIDRIAALGDDAEDAAAGVGLAAAFVNPDRLDEVCDVAARLPTEWHPAFHLGLCFGLKARSINDSDQFDRDLALLDDGRQAAVRASISACDRIEREVRSHGLDYRAWRVRVTDWMKEHIVYPIVGVRVTDERVAVGHRSALTAPTR